MRRVWANWRGNTAPEVFHTDNDYYENAKPTKIDPGVQNKSIEGNLSESNSIKV